MPFAVEMYFDSEAEARIRCLWDQLANAEVSSFMIDIGARPHLSLAVYPSVDSEALCRELASFARSFDPISLEFASIGVFPGNEGVVYSAPTVTPELLAAHRRYHDQMQRLAPNCMRYYHPGKWTPHCTIATGVNVERRSQAVELCHSSNALGPFTIKEIGLIEFRPVRTICVHPTPA